MPNGKKKQTTKGNAFTNARRKMNGNGNANRTTQPMASRSRRSGMITDQTNSRLVQNQNVVMKGSDFITKVTVRKSTTPQSRILASFPISPSAYPGTRLTQLSNLYEFFRFNSFRIRYVSAVPDTIACQFVVYIDLDPLDDAADIGDPDTLIRQAVAQTGAMQFNFNHDKNIPLAMRTDRQLYFTGTDKQNARFSQQGRAYLIQVTDPIDFNGGEITGPLDAGSLFIDWSCVFCTPQLNPSALVNTLPQGALSSTKALTYTYTPATEDEVQWTPSWAPGGAPLLKPRTYYIATLYLSYVVLRSYCARGNNAYMAWIDQSGSLLASLSKAAVNPPEVPGLLGSLIFETDATGIPKNNPICLINDMEGIQLGLVIRPLYVDGSPFPSPLFENKLVDEAGHFSPFNLADVSLSLKQAIMTLPLQLEQEPSLTAECARHVGCTTPEFPVLPC